ncbi:Putative inorganic phosphate transporter C8E4,01c [Schizosaccharomyces pombe 972h-] [Rhizoctonia solani]|uniref:Putative inorganic phosphate transporter C8E4,01c [Schizosaccharomyces pombe 972h-] n=1 Tax=Rhizoctonia solani TaxID=456999 RepID=A0A0K6FQB4_9AGAM|nr:Putative inorganic phosphate transporter C8E4,01c [Schizosaccharomyces pombe 972h-] [Rhizoctonia solani]
MDPGRQEQSGLLAEDYDDEALGSPHSPQPHEGAQARSGHPKYYYRTLVVLFVANGAVIAAFQVVYPFINQMVVELGIAKDPDSAGYYSGLFESGISLAGFVTALPCSYLSDTFGRKPVMIASMIGTMISLFFFGTGRTFLGLFISRCIGGAVGPQWTWTGAFTVLGDTTDAATAGGAYSGINVAYSVGNMISPSIGGFLVHPSDHFAAFQGEFWKNNPFALPCFVGVVICAITMLVIMVALPETLPSKDGWAHKQERRMSASMHASVYSTASTGPGLDGLISNHTRSTSLRRGRHSREATDDSEYQAASETLLPAKGPVSIWSVVTPETIPVLITSFALAFLAASSFTLYPLWAFTAISKGGLGASESSIGLQMSIRGLFHVLTLLLYAPIERRLGLYRLYAYAMVMWVLSGLCYPLLSAWAKANNSSEGLLFQVLLIVWFTLWSFATFVWTANSQMVNLVAPSDEALARLIGVSTICILLGQTLGPVLVTSLFQWSISLEFAGGNLIWILMFIASSVSALHAFTLKPPAQGRHTRLEESLTLQSVEDLGGNRRSWAE